LRRVVCNKFKADHAPEKAHVRKDADFETPASIRT